MSEASDSQAPRNTSRGAIPPRVSAAKHWCFTWFDPYDCEVLNSWMQMSMVSKIVAQEETCPETAKDHVQGYLCFLDKQRPMTVFSEHPRIHWEVARNPDASIVYCSKDSTRKTGGQRWIAGVTLKTSIRVITPRGWQQDLLDRLPSMMTRKIYWYWEPTGNTGKSALAKYLCVVLDALLISGKGADVKSAIHSMKTKPKLILCDIPRSSTQFVSYTAIEEVSNGCFFSGKYEGGMVLMDEPVIIVFANEEPDYSKMSSDRWEIFRVPLGVTNGSTGSMV